VKYQRLIVIIVVYKQEGQLQQIWTDDYYVL